MLVYYVMLLNMIRYHSYNKLYHTHVILRSYLYCADRIQWRMLPALPLNTALFRDNKGHSTLAEHTSHMCCASGHGVTLCVVSVRMIVCLVCMSVFRCALGH